MRRKSILLPALCIFVLLLVAGRLFFFHTVRIEGTSMNNTLESGDVVLVLRLPGYTPKRGHIVECSFPGRDGKYIKRIVGLPGETVEITGSDTFINGRPLREKYVSSEADAYSVQLGNEQYLLLGDNRAESYDSRAEEIGPVDASCLHGRVVFSLWPLKSLF